MNGGLSEAFEGLQVNLMVPDLWQQEAIRSVAGGEDVILSAPTGAGKTLVFESLVEGSKFPPSGKQVVYTVPTRALANDKWREWKQKGWKVGIVTGDLAENIDAPVLVATLETQRERMLSGKAPFLLVIDEYQMIGDRRRGLSYELAIALAPLETRLLLMSGSVSNPQRVAEWFERLGRNVRIVKTEERPVPLDEVPFEAMPRSAPRKFQTFWQRLAVGALLSNFGPLLIFAPHRKSAEKIAWKIAEAFPDDEPIEFSDEKLRRTCSAPLARMLRKRVAIHHSGMSFGERAAIVEPLAKAGQLRVVVATMGLAAGINFSVRSVFVSDTVYQDGPFEREVAPDELLQMFGRAGRRGLDETGFVISGSRSPRLYDARPLELHRNNDIDWPTLLRRMHHAAKSGESPFESAREIRDRLFSRQSVPLGFTGKGISGRTEPSEGEALFNLVPTRKEILNSAGEWETESPESETTSAIRDSLRWVKGKYRSASSDPSLISEILPEGCRLCRLDSKTDRERIYGMEMPVASRSGEGSFYLTKNARKITGRGKPESTFTEEEATVLFSDLFESAIAPACFFDLVERGRTLYLRGNFSASEIPVTTDSLSKMLSQPGRRSVEIKAETHYLDESTGDSFDPSAGSPAHAWRKLSLIDDQGAPTDRGVLCSFFQHGEGLAVAAALEDLHYPIDEMIYHFANLRAGHRFEVDDPAVGGGSERLAASCRQAYGPTDYEGYLRLGLPETYGEGAAEVIAQMLAGKLHLLFSGKAPMEFGPGDVERAFIEWISFLRHIRNAPDIENERWRQLKQAAEEELKKRDRRSPLIDLPSMPTTILQRRPQNRIHISHL